MNWFNQPGVQVTGISEFPLQNDPNQTNPYPYGPSNQQNFVGQQTQMGPIDHFAACNEGIAAGFGPMFFNMRDPNLGKTNHPVKQDPSLHAAVVVGSAILFAGIIVAVVGYYSLFHAQTLPIVLLIVLPYLLYVVLSICCSTIRGYITNLKRFEQYKRLYDIMVTGKGYFRFWIQCYHYVTVRTGKSSSRRKVVTHTATIDYQVRECYDESGQIESIYENTTYVFINYLKRFYFTDNKSEENFRRAFNAFVTANIRDVYQNHSHTFELVGYEEEVGFTAAGSNPHNGILFYVFTLLGMGLVYSFIIERMASRYEVGILKRLTA